MPKRNKKSNTTTIYGKKNICKLKCVEILGNTYFTVVFVIKKSKMGWANRAHICQAIKSMGTPPVSKTRNQA